MKNMVISALVKAGEKTANLPKALRSAPGKFYQPKMPKKMQVEISENK